MTVLPTESQK